VRPGNASAFAAAEATGELEPGMGTGPRRRQRRKKDGNRSADREEFWGEEAGPIGGDGLGEAVEHAALLHPPASGG
jgi:hypothetical protein